MGRAEERRKLKLQKQQFKKQGMSDKNYQDFMNKLDNKYYQDIIITAFEDVYNVFYKELQVVMKENRISEERANKILRQAMEQTRKHDFNYVRREV